MLIASSCHHILSDNALFNFGVVNSNVVIIDAGSRSGERQPSKGAFNKKVMTQFWSKAKLVIHPDFIAPHRDEWRMAGADMVTALKTYETIWQQLRSDGHSFSVLNSLKERKSTTAECPHVASVLDSLGTGTLDWLTQKYLWGKLAEYGPSGDGYTRRQDRSYTAAEKLEFLISETHERRVIQCNNPAEDILNEDELEVILHAWKDDYRRWMRPETLRRTRGMKTQKWHQCLRTAFRSHLFQMAGSYEMTLFFLVAPFNNENLLVFRNLLRLDDCKAHVRERARDTPQA